MPSKAYFDLKSTCNVRMHHPLKVTKRLDRLIIIIKQCNTHSIKTFDEPNFESNVP